MRANRHGIYKATFNYCTSVDLIIAGNVRVTRHNWQD